MQVAECMNQYGRLAELWQTAAAETARLSGALQMALPTERAAQLAVAQIQAIGFEAGLWDLLGTVTVARKALESLSSMPCMSG